MIILKLVRLCIMKESELMEYENEIIEARIGIEALRVLTSDFVPNIDALIHARCQAMAGGSSKCRRLKLRKIRRLHRILKEKIERKLAA